MMGGREERSFFWKVGRKKEMRRREKGRAMEGVGEGATRTWKKKPFKSREATMYRLRSNSRSWIAMRAQENVRGEEGEGSLGEEEDEEETRREKRGKETEEEGEWGDEGRGDD